MNEFKLIDKIKTILKNRVIGDDTAPIIVGNKTLIVTNDILLEGQHFLDYFPIDNLGWKAISVNVSDIAASGGKPKYALISLLLPKSKTHLVKKICRPKKCKAWRLCISDRSDWQLESRTGTSDDEKESL